MHGTITHFDKATGVGWLETGSLESPKVPFFVVPGSDYKVGDRVRFNLGYRAIQLEVDNGQLSESIR
jgi:hypothetical protein